MVAPQVIITGRIRSIPASEERAPAALLFVHLLDGNQKAQSHDWTMTPIKLATPRKAMKPNGVCITARAIRAPIDRKGGRKDEEGLTAFLKLDEKREVDADERDQKYTAD